MIAFGVLLATSLALAGQGPAKVYWVSYEVNPVADRSPAACKVSAVADPETQQNVSFTPSDKFTAAACLHFLDELQRWVRPGEAWSFEIRREIAIWSEGSPDIPTFMQPARVD